MEQVSPTNLFDKARALRAIVWKKSVQGLDVCVIAKGAMKKQEGDTLWQLYHMKNE